MDIYGNNRSLFILLELENSDLKKTNWKSHLKYI